MLTREVTYIDIVDGEEVERTEKVRFAYTPVTIRLYEQHNDSKFLADLSTASKAFSTLLHESQIETMGNDLSDSEKLVRVMPLFSDVDICTFMLKAIPCLYFEVHGGIRLQSEETWEDASESLWLMQLVNLSFFMEVFSELNAVKTLPVKGKSKKKVKSG